jgi:membrane protein implicated in regulation of membrane protease activity
MFESGASTLSCVYTFLLFIGVAYAVFILITGGLSDIDMPDVDIDIPTIDLPGDVDISGTDVHIGGAGPVGGIDSPDVGLSPLSPITVATFVTTFGGIGIISVEFFGVDLRMSLVWATLAGILVAGTMYLIVSRFLIGSQSSSEVRRGELLGLEAEVSVPIGATTAGQVVYITKSGRMISTARSATGEPIGRGEFVRIVRVSGPQVLVRPLEGDAE